MNIWTTFSANDCIASNIRRHPDLAAFDVWKWVLGGKKLGALTFTECRTRLNLSTVKCLRLESQQRRIFHKCGVWCLAWYQIRFHRIPSNAQNVLCHYATCVGPKTIFRCLQLDSCMFYAWVAMRLRLRHWGTSAVGEQSLNNVMNMSISKILKWCITDKRNICRKCIYRVATGWTTAGSEFDYR
jgi:hypothetical protein